MRWTWNLRPRGLLKLLGPLVARMGRRQEEAIWTGLKRYLEKRAQRTDAARPPIAGTTDEEGDDGPVHDRTT
jgi:hypothetical protein